MQVLQLEIEDLREELEDCKQMNATLKWQFHEDQVEALEV